MSKNVNRPNKYNKTVKIKQHTKSKFQLLPLFSIGAARITDYRHSEVRAVPKIAPCCFSILNIKKHFQGTKSLRIKQFK